ncbi:hypothetical protein ABIE71_000318 [Bradyrhizobium diazoefficiens]
MKTGKTIQPLSNAAIPWTAWASRLMARHRRWPDAPRATLLLHTRLSRTPAQLTQRWLSFHGDFHTLFNVAINGRSTHSVQQRPTGARPMQFNPARNLLQSHGLPAMVAVQRAARLALTGLAPEQQHTLISRPHMRLRDDADQTPVSRLLARRLRRPSEESPKRTAMALRRESAPPAASRLPSIDVPAERRLFEPQPRWTGEAAVATPAINVEQLASQVLKHIDRRVIARRERMGQV